MNTYAIALDDVNDLQLRSLIELANSYGGVESLQVLATPDGRAFVEDMKASRGSKQRRRLACRDAMVDWLYSVDSVSPPGTVRDKMLQDPVRGYFFAESFSDDDLDYAAAWLQRQSLVRGTMVDQAQGPVILYLTDSGVTCAEEFGSDTDGYLRRQQQASGPTVNIGTNSAPFQVAGDNAHQVQYVNTSAEHLRELITSIAELVRLSSTDVSGLDTQRTAALAAASDGAVDRSALKRFTDWALAVVGKGASAALSPAVTAATNDLLREAERLAAHL
jgi:hypothetical protein